jgi:hypothetical protein
VDGHLDFPASKFLGSESERVRASLLLSLALLRTRACSIARPCHTKYRTMFTMIDTIGARAGHATARAPAIHRVRCVRFSRGPARTRPKPCRRRRVTCAAQPPHEDFIPRAARSIHQPASLAAAAAADAQELMSVAGGVLDGGEARRMRFDVASKNLSNDVHGAVRAYLFASSHPYRATPSHPPLCPT